MTITYNFEPIIGEYDFRVADEKAYMAIAEREVQNICNSKSKKEQQLVVEALLKYMKSLDSSFFYEYYKETLREIFEDDAQFECAESIKESELRHEYEEKDYRRSVI